MSATTSRVGRYQDEELYARASTDLFDLGGGPAALNFGADSEHSRQASLGVDWTATAWLSLSADWFDIRIDDRIRAVSAQEIVECLYALRPSCPSGLHQLGPVRSNRPQIRLRAR